MLAISSITPGPVGVNVATFAGFATSGILGAVIATTAIILPSYIIVTIVFKILDKFKTNKNIQGAIRALKPAGCALFVFCRDKIIIHFKSPSSWNILLLALIITSILKKQDPLFYLGISALVGLFLGHFNWIGV